MIFTSSSSITCILWDYQIAKKMFSKTRLPNLYIYCFFHGKVVSLHICSTEQCFCYFKVGRPLNNTIHLERPTPSSDVYLLKETEVEAHLELNMRMVLGLLGINQLKVQLTTTTTTTLQHHIETKHLNHIDNYGKH